MPTQDKNSKLAAIDLDEIAETPLAELTADTFLEALVAGKSVEHLRFWPEKKKYELYQEPESIGEVRFGRFRDILKGEKKKTELEVPPDLWERLRDGKPLPLPFDIGQYERFVNRLAEDIEIRLRERRR